MKIYNTLTRKKEEFEPEHYKKVAMYSCGPTVYQYAHIGNLRSYVNVDILRRWLEHQKYSVKHVMNITDVGHLTSDADSGEDKMERAAKEEGKTARQIADFYSRKFFEDAATLNIQKPLIVAKATDFIKEQIDFIKGLSEKGYTYELSDGIYFDTSKLKNYGELARIIPKKLKAGARVKVVKGKRNITDFALWKFSPTGQKRQMEWDSPWGVGFPGWHIECSAISRKYLGDSFDIHTGGIDHIPIHHTNEIAQSEALTGKLPAHWWFHSAFLSVEGQKMSKSLGNIYTIDQMTEKFKAEPLALRMLFLQSHYRDPLNFTHSSIIDAQNTLNHLRDFVLRITQFTPKKGEKIGRYSRFNSVIDTTHKKFERAMNDDLALPKALAVVFDFMKKVNKEKDYNPKEARDIYNFMMDINKIIGLDLDRVREAKIPEKVKKLAKKRESLRKAGDFKKADLVRKEIESHGYIVEDTGSGPVLKKK